MKKITGAILFISLATLLLATQVYGSGKNGMVKMTKVTGEVMNWKEQPKAFWKERLSDEQFRVCRTGGTEKPFSGRFNDFKEKGVFVCSSCGQELFKSETKYNSGTGWPSFREVISRDKVELLPDNTLFSKRTEVRCSRCGAHLGHVFDDGPPPTNKRYCINSVCLDFIAQ